MADPAAPKFDYKMLVLPAVMLFSKKIDFKDPDIVQKLQMLFGTVAAIILAVHFFLYTRIMAAKETKKIWVPPKPKPQLPFGLGPAPEPVTVEDYEATTYQDYEVKELKAAAQSILMSVGITTFMSLQFGVHMSLLIQSIMMPMNILELVHFKKYVFGTKKNADGSLLYNELFNAPTEEAIALINKLAIAKQQAANAPVEDEALKETKEGEEDDSAKEPKNKDKDESDKDK